MRAIFEESDGSGFLRLADYRRLSIKRCSLNIDVSLVKVKTIQPEWGFFFSYRLRAVNIAIHFIL
jgi:hypothetical protein